MPVLVLVLSALYRPYYSARHWRNRRKKVDLFQLGILKKQQDKCRTTTMALRERIKP